MTQQTDASVRFESLWETAKGAAYGDAPAIDGIIQPAVDAPDFAGNVGALADGLLRQGLVDQDGHDRMLAGARDIDAVLESVPADRLEALLGSPTSLEGGS